MVWKKIWGRVRCKYSNLLTGETCIHTYLWGRQARGTHTETNREVNINKSTHWPGGRPCSGLQWHCGGRLGCSQRSSSSSLEECHGLGNTHWPTSWCSCTLHSSAATHTKRAMGADEKHKTSLLIFGVKVLSCECRDTGNLIQNKVPRWSDRWPFLCVPFP